ncbi:uncharacterized protein VICG_00583 [Vittaforma corneae ATCC 50505]|uniref:Ricin B lectin domain-containing protein n=1 Tax=Vittaforma corneae (strain ATCC 50505) TaxID=993615 RepID=L2GPD5_VITCO|nr:uncharacterized protein VICG_00583 [Vittaforma corneae ATCC 50505]ELA42484.1 hypothetical protein VICG_00583 [Vittaforma corneae ATCC 50505]
MFLVLIFLLVNGIVRATALSHEFELYDAHNPNFILAVRDNILFFINEQDARTQKEATVFQSGNEILKHRDKNVCNDGIGGRDLRLCKYADIFSEWKLRPVPNGSKIFELRDWSGQRCAVYGPFDRNERDIEVGPCFGNAVKFRVVNMDEYINGTNERTVAENTGILNRIYDRFIPKRSMFNF